MSSSSSSSSYRVWPPGAAHVQQGELDDHYTPPVGVATTTTYAADPFLSGPAPSAPAAADTNTYTNTYYTSDTQLGGVHGRQVAAATGVPMRQVLIILSGEDHLDLASGKHKETGFFLSELAIPYFQLKAQGYQVVFANPNGSTPHMDPMSNSTLWFGIDGGDQLDRAKKMLREEPTFMRPVMLNALDETALQQFRGVFIPGGHAPMQDLIRTPEVGRILAHFHNYQKPTGTICHGAAALIPARKNDNSWLYSGYTMCCYSNAEEWMTELMWWDKVPTKLETALKESGGVMEQAWPMASRVVEDRELVSAQNPRSADKFASLFVAKLNRYPEVALAESTPLAEQHQANRSSSFIPLR